MLAIMWISFRKDISRGEPLSGIIWFGLTIIAFCAVIALLAVSI